MIRPTILALALLAAACGAPTAEQESGPQAPAPALALSDAWATVTPGGVDVSAGYMTISNSGAEPDRLLGASTLRAQSVELHTMSLDAGGVMRMNQVQALDVPAGGTLVLAPGGNHLMLVGLVEPLVAGEEITLMLRFERSGEMQATLPVRLGTGAGGH